MPALPGIDFVLIRYGLNDVSRRENFDENFPKDYHELIVEPRAMELIPRIVRHYGEPFADDSAIPSFYLAEMARRHVTVALNGDGGHEVPSRPLTGTTPNPDIPVYGNNGALNCYVRVTHDLAMSMAADADARLGRAARGGAPVPLGCGVPIAIKDIFAVGGVELTLGCPLMKGNVASERTSGLLRM